MRSYFAQPGLIAYEIGCFEGDAGCNWGKSFDIVGFAPRAVVSPASDHEKVSKASGYARIMQGVLATRMEWALLSSSERGGKAEVRNATEVFRIAREQGVRTATLRPGNAGQQTLAGLSLPNNVKSELSTSLVAGNTLVVPIKLLRVNGEPQIAWWQLNERSGELIGIMPGGRGQGMDEYIQIAKGAGWVIAALFTVGLCTGSLPGMKPVTSIGCAHLCIAGAIVGFFFIFASSLAGNVLGFLLAALFSYWQAICS
jgi:hypothetical protein